MDTLDYFFGHTTNLNTLQMCVRTLVVFVFVLVLIRLTGMRAFGIKSAFDTCIIIILGAILGRAVVGASPFLPTLAACTVLMIVHKVIASLSVNNDFISHLVKGVPVLLYKDGVLFEKNLRKCDLSRGDVMEEVRLRLEQNTLENVDEIYMERTGKISVTEKKGLDKKDFDEVVNYDKQ